MTFRDTIMYQDTVCKIQYTQGTSLSSGLNILVRMSCNEKAWFVTISALQATHRFRL